MLTIMCGLPRSGKTTYAMKMAERYVRISPDDIRRALHGQAFYGPAEPFVWAIAETMTRALLLVGRHVVIDATNTTVRERLRWRQIASEFDTRLDIYWIRTGLETCLARQRPDEAVPDDVIRRMAQRFEPPTSVEGCVTEPVDY